MKKNCMSCMEKLALVFHFLTGVAIFVGGYVFLSGVEDVMNLAGTQWILIAILFGILAINMSLKSGGCALFGKSKEECSCENGRCE